MITNSYGEFGISLLNRLLTRLTLSMQTDFNTG